jgi:hypothetical protein
MSSTTSEKLEAEKEDALKYGTIMLDHRTILQMSFYNSLLLALVSLKKTEIKHFHIQTYHLFIYQKIST